MNREEKIRHLEKSFLRRDLPSFDVGDNIIMRIKVKEANKIRIHPFEGTVIRKSGQGLKSTFTVRKVSFGEGVERTFPLHSPVIEDLQIVSKGMVRRSKLYYLRQRMGKSAKVKKETVSEKGHAGVGKES